MVLVVTLSSSVLPFWKILAYFVIYGTELERYLIIFIMFRHVWTCALWNCNSNYERNITAISQWFETAWYKMISFSVVHITLWRWPHIFPKSPKWTTSVNYSLLCQTTQGYLEQPGNISYLTFLILLCVRNMLKLLKIWSKPIKCNKEYFSSLVPNIFSNPPLPFRQI